MPEQLTPGQIKVLKYARQHPDATFAEIALALGVKYSTVKHHLQEVRGRLGCRSTAGAIRKAESLGYLIG